MPVHNKFLQTLIVKMNLKEAVKLISDQVKIAKGQGTCCQTHIIRICLRSNFELKQAAKAEGEKDFEAAKRKTEELEKEAVS